MIKIRHLQIISIRLAEELICQVFFHLVILGELHLVWDILGLALRPSLQHLKHGQSERPQTSIASASL